MRKRFISLMPALVSVLCLSMTALAEVRPPSEQEPLGAGTSTSQFDPRDLSGIWEMATGGGAAMGIGPTPPPLTPPGMEILSQRIPARGPRAVPYPGLSNDPDYKCNPAGFPKLLFDQEPIEMILLDDRLLQLFQWEHRVRVLWLDGRELPSGENLDNLGPAWYGHSVAEWQGDTLVVNTVGLDERAWLDRQGYPKSFNARIEERYRRIGPDTIELHMTFYDPENYTAPWVGNTKTFAREPPEYYTFFGWEGLFSGITESICAPMDEVEGYNEAFRDISEPSRVRQ